MATKPRLWTPKGHRAVDYNQNAIEKLLAEGLAWAGIKWDGFRCHILRIDGQLKVTTREGIELTSLSPLYESLDALLYRQGKFSSHVVFDGEVLVRGVTFEEGSGLLRRIEPLDPETIANVQFILFDCETRDTFEGTNAGQSSFRDRRLELLHLDIPQVGFNRESSATVVLEELTAVAAPSDVERLYSIARAKGYEGLVIKNHTLCMRNGKVAGQYKVKPGCGAEFAPGWEGDGIIKDYVWGEPGKCNEGKIVGFVVELENGRKVNATGLTQERMSEYTLAFIAWRDQVPADEGAALAIPQPYVGQYAEVSAMEETADGSLRHPHFVRFRDIEGAEGIKA